MENNVRRFSLFRRYNAAVPQFLHDRPPTLINHCMERLSSASEIEKQSIEVLDEERGTFKVKSQDPNSQEYWYNLSFGDDKTMPHCQCIDWEKNLLPCKHFFAIFNHFDNWAFEKFPAHYSESPFLTLDRQLVFSKELLHPIEEQDTELEVPAMVEHVDASVISNLGASEILQRQKFNRGLDTRCKEGVKQVTSLLHVVDDTESLKEAYKLICCCIETLSKAAHKEEGLVLEKVPPKSATCTHKSSSACGLIPKAKRKHTFSGRHGITAETMKKTLMVNVDVTTGQPICKYAKNDQNIETEIAPMDLDQYAFVSEVNIVPTDQQPAHAYDVDPGIVLVEMWMEITQNDTKVTLYNKNKENILKEDGWLCSSEINAAQLLLSRQFTHVNGLRDADVVGPLVSPAFSEIVQIINVGKHWVCLSTVGCFSGHVNVFDSLATVANSTTIDQVCRMLSSPCSAVKLANQKVQVQSNAYDCGLLAIAFATDLCHGSNPVGYCYETRTLRSHLVRCIEMQHMSPFPRSGRKVQIRP